MCSSDLKSFTSITLCDALSRSGAKCDGSKGLVSVYSIAVGRRKQGPASLYSFWVHQSCKGAKHESYGLRSTYCLDCVLWPLESPSYNNVQPLQCRICFQFVCIWSVRKTLGRNPPMQRTMFWRSTGTSPHQAQAVGFSIKAAGISKRNELQA